MRTNLHLPSEGKRQIFDLSRFNLPEVPYLAAQNLPFTSLALPPHVHKGRMEINHILKGERVYRVGNSDYHLRGNEIFVTWPDEVHGSGSYLHGRGTHFWMQIELPQPGNAFLGLDASRSATVIASLWELPKRHFPANEEMRGIFAKILQLCQAEPSELTSARLTSLLLNWILDVIDCSSRPFEDGISPDIHRALELMQSNPTQYFTVTQLAEASCLSESRFKAKFSKQLGVPPGDYLQRRRLEMAIPLLGSGQSVSQIAQDLGFSSSQHFSTAFKKFFGQSPVAWLRENCSGVGPQQESGLQENRLDENGLRPWIDADGWLHGFICPE